MPITRSFPRIGYFSPEIGRAFGMSQTVRAGNLVLFSGIVAADETGTVIAKGDFPGQLRAILAILRNLLEVENLDLTNLVSTTFYTTDIGALQTSSAIIAELFSAHPPVMTWMEVNRLVSPDFLLELVPIACS